MSPAAGTGTDSGGEGRHGACGLLGTVPQPWGGDGPPRPCREGGEGKKGAAARRYRAPGVFPAVGSAGAGGPQGACAVENFVPCLAGRSAGPGRPRGATGAVVRRRSRSRGGGRGMTTTPRVLRGAGVGGAGCPARSPEIAAVPGTGRLPRVGPRRAARSSGGGSVRRPWVGKVGKGPLVAAGCGRPWDHRP